MINLKVIVPSARFSEVMQEFVSKSTRGQRDSINARMLDILIRVYKETKRANRDEIGRLLGVVAYRAFGKTGKRLKKAKIVIDEGQSLAFRIIQKRFFERTGMFLPAEVAKQDAIKMINARMRSSGFMASGFVPALRKFNAIVKGGARYVLGTDAQQRGKDKGYGTVAQTDDNPFAEIGNNTKIASEIAGPALQAALSGSQAWMEKKMLEDAEKVAQSMAGKTI